MDDGGHHLRDTQTHTHTDTDTDTDARTFFSRDLMVCRGRFTIGPFGAIMMPAHAQFNYNNEYFIV